MLICLDSQAYWRHSNTCNCLSEIIQRLPISYQLFGVRLHKVFAPAQSTFMQLALCKMAVSAPLAMILAADGD